MKHVGTHIAGGGTSLTAVLLMPRASGQTPSAFPSTANGEWWHLHRRHTTARATRRSIRSTDRTSTSSRSRGGSRPTTSARVPSTSWKARRSRSRACSTPPAARGGRSIALDAKTGEVIWTHSLREGQARRRSSPRQLSGRGVSYWTDGKGDDRVIYVTTGYQLVELNAKTGAMIPIVRQETASSI